MSQQISSNPNNKSFIVSADKDFLQLVTNNITVYRPVEKEYYTPQTVIDKFQLTPHNFILQKTLLGDNSDNVKGIKGLGEKGLLKKFPELTLTQKEFKLYRRLKKMLDMDLKYIQVDYTMK